MRGHRGYNTRRQGVFQGPLTEPLTISSSQSPQITKPIPSTKKNEVYKNPDFVPGQTINRAVPIHYSNLALAMKRTPELEAIAEESRTDKSQPFPEVVATRVRATGVHYDWKRRRWSWQRLAENVVEIDPQTSYSTALDWTKSQRRMPFIRTPTPLRECRCCSSKLTCVCTALSSDLRLLALPFSPRVSAASTLHFPSSFSKLSLTHAPLCSAQLPLYLF